MTDRAHSARFLHLHWPSGLQYLYGACCWHRIFLGSSPLPFQGGFSLATRKDGGTLPTINAPPLPPRSSPPTSGHDLRPDDFAYTMAIGDSITTGAFSRGLQSNPFLGLSGWRGQSYAAEMDDGAVTIPNFMKHYNSAVAGGSKGSNSFPEICFDRMRMWINSMLLRPVPWHPIYHTKSMTTCSRKWPSAIFPVANSNYINFRIGSNDLCWLCAQATIGIGPGSADDFESHIRETLEAVREAIPNTLVNLPAVFKVSHIFELTLNQPYCCKLLPVVPHKNLECACPLLGGQLGAATREQMDLLTDQYNARLLKIVTDYQVANYPDFAVVWQPPVVSLRSYLMEALSAVDCFHPSLKSHELLASGIWNRLVASTEEKPVAVRWSTAVDIRCIQEDDRILIKNLL